MRALRFHAPLILLLAAALAAAPACLGRRGPRNAIEGAFKLDTAWDVPVAESGAIQLAAAPGGFVSVTAAGEFAFHDAGTGKVRWKTPAGSPIAGSLVVGGLQATRGKKKDGSGWAAAVTEEGDVAIFGLGTGEPLATWNLGWSGATLTPWGDELLALDPRGALALLRPGESASRWELRLPPVAPAPAAICGDVALLGLADGRLLAIHPELGRVAWRKKLGSPLAAAVACDAKSAYAATADNDLRALKLHRHSAGRRWKIRSGADPAAAPVVRPGLVALLSKDTYFYGFNPRNGHLLFRVRLDRRPGPAALLDDVIFVAGSHVTSLVAYRLPRGLAAGSYTLPVGGHFVTPPVISGDHLAIGVARYGEGATTLVGLSRSAVVPPAPEPKDAAPPDL